jgi:hypothetical protein
MDPRVLAQRRVAQSQKERSILPTLAVACCVIVPIFVLVVHQRSSPPLRPLAIVTSMKPLEPLDDGEQATVLPSSGASVAALPLKPAAPASEEEMAQPAGLPRRRHKRLKPRRAGFEGGAYVAHTVESSNPPPPPAASASAATATAAVADHESGQAMAVLNRERAKQAGQWKSAFHVYKPADGFVRPGGDLDEPSTLGRTLPAAAADGELMLLCIGGSGSMRAGMNLVMNFRTMGLYHMLILAPEKEVWCVRTCSWTPLHASAHHGALASPHRCARTCGPRCPRSRASGGLPILETRSPSRRRSTTRCSRRRRSPSSRRARCDLSLDLS